MQWSQQSPESCNQLLYPDDKPVNSEAFTQKTDALSHRTEQDLSGVCSLDCDISLIEESPDGAENTGAEVWFWLNETDRSGGGSPQMTRCGPARVTLWWPVWVRVIKALPGKHHGGLSEPTRLFGSKQKCWLRPRRLSVMSECKIKLNRK